MFEWLLPFGVAEDELPGSLPSKKAEKETKKEAWLIRKVCKTVMSKSVLSWNDSRVCAAVICWAEG